MAFPSDGQNHYKAVKSESELIDYKNQIEKHFSKPILEIIHVGGTTSKIDNIIRFIDGEVVNASLKNKKSIRSGSFDYVNTSNFDWVSNGFSKTFEVYEKYKNSENLSAYTKLKKCISDDLVQIDDNLLTDLFIDNVIKKYTDLNLFVIDEKSRNIYCDVIPKSFNLIKNGGKLTLRKTDGVKMSYGIDGVDLDGNKVDIGLRIRVHLNNGKTKWLYKGSSNLVIKFQQDKVYSIL